MNAHDIGLICFRFFLFFFKEPAYAPSNVSANNLFKEILYLLG
jgi:hypothetical protein